MTTSDKVVLALALTVACCSADENPEPFTPEQIEADQRKVCELRGLCATEMGSTDFSVEDCIADLDTSASYSDECGEVFAARNECLAEATTCAEYEDAQYELSHRCRDLVVDAEVTFCGPVAEMTDSSQ